MIEDFSWVNDGRPFKEGDPNPTYHCSESTVNKFVDTLNKMVYTINRLEKEIEVLRGFVDTDPESGIDW